MLLDGRCYPQFAVQLAQANARGWLRAVEADEDVVGTSRVRELERPSAGTGAPEALGSQSAVGSK
jgi:hypothetical protein